MVIETQNNIPEKWFFDNITSWLKELMDKITWWINDILVKLWLKKEEEINKETEKTQKELSEMMVEINNSVKDDWKLNKEELGLINKNKEIKNHYDWLNKTFWEDIAKREIDIFLQKIKEWTEDNNLSEEEKKEIQSYYWEQQEKIEEDENLKTIIKNFPSIKNPKNWSSIENIIKVYEEIKWEDEDKKPTQDQVLEKLNENG